MGANKFSRITQRIVPLSKLIRAWALQGGVSAQVTALEIERANGERLKLIVRQHGAADLLANPNIAADEFKLLARLREAGLPVPAPYIVGASGDILDTPYIVVEYIEGSTEFAPSDLSDHLQQMALALAQIHSLNDVAPDFAFLPREAVYTAARLRENPPQMDESLGEGRIRDALETLGWRESRNPVVLLHGDYWSGNVLWQGERLAAVIDWEDAKLGDPLADIANARLEILWAFGRDAMQEFTEHYQAAANFDLTDLPYRDLIAALKPMFKLAAWAADEHAERDMREKHQWFVEQALAKLSHSEQ